MAGEDLGKTRAMRWGRLFYIIVSAAPQAMHARACMAFVSL
jgi:hypothetical protein